MSLFSVDWPPDILASLADIWLQASDRQAVTNAETHIDRLLSRDLLGQGIHISEGLYRLEVPPLIVTYTVDLTRHHVEISSIRAGP
jgi:hypothetical protein